MKQQDVICELHVKIYMNRINMSNFMTINTITIDLVEIGPYTKVNSTIIKLKRFYN